MIKKRNSWKSFIKNKQNGTGQPIVMITAYDYSSAIACDKAEADIILVGDSLGNVMLGYDTTIPVTLDEMIHHTKAVVRGAGGCLVVIDLPFGSYQLSPEQGLATSIRAFKETGADAVKIEGGAEVADTIRAITAAGIPVVAHLGLTPQSVKMMGGYVIQGKTQEAVDKILADAKAVQEAGAVMLVLECLPAAAGKYITEQLSIPTIGIGGGPDCDGQVLVFHDLLGFFDGKPNKFVKVFANVGTIIEDGIRQYATAVRNGSFPAEEHCFKMAEGEEEKLGKIY